MPAIEKVEDLLLTPDVYGSTPFQYEATAEPNNSVFVLRPVKAVGYWQTTTITVARVPALPVWTITSR